MQCRTCERADDAGRARGQAGGAAPHGAGRAQGRGSSCSTSRPMPATPAPPPISRVFDSLHNTLKALAGRRLHGRGAGRASTRCATRIIEGNAARFGAHANVACPHPRRRPCAARALAARDRGAVGSGAGPAAERRRARSSCSASSSATSSSASSPPSATRATRCGCCSRRASRRPTPSRPSTAGCARISAPTPCCISAPTARWSSCRASRPACPAACWPDRLIGDLPNLYLYAANNPSEGTIAKRRARRRR